MKDLAQRMRLLREEIEGQRMEADRALAAKDLVRAGQLRYATIPMLEKELRRLQALH